MAICYEPECSESVITRCDRISVRGNLFLLLIFILIFSSILLRVCNCKEIAFRLVFGIGGLATPRNPVELRVINGKKYAIDNQGKDVTEKFEKGANEVLKLAERLNIKKVILQPRSPSCGVNKIYSGNFDNKLVDGNGILTEILKQNGIEVINADDI